VREARETFVAPAELGRFAPGSTIRVVEVCVGTGSNTAALLEACAERQLQLHWWGLELDSAPLRLALTAGAFRQQWQPRALEPLDQLASSGGWHGPLGCGRMLWGDARQQVAAALAEARGRTDLVLHDAFSPRHCPQLWSVEFLASLAELLTAQGRLITYCSAAAVRQGLQLAGLQLAAIPPSSALHQGSGSSPARRAWSGGTVASPAPLPASTWLRTLEPMEMEHLATNAAEPYRDPTGGAEAQAILAARNRAQARRLAEGSTASTNAWRRRWGLERPA
jgi:tRNA U34 5-methylaminomethyl-2-thiouridine-forming methyltransferase MnmC